jgi:hypothetical protein
LGEALSEEGVDLECCANKEGASGGTEVVGTGGSIMLEIAGEALARKTVRSSVPLRGGGVDACGGGLKVLGADVETMDCKEVGGAAEAKELSIVVDRTGS